VLICVLVFNRVLEAEVVLVSFHLSTLTYCQNGLLTHPPGRCCKPFLHHLLFFNCGDWYMQGLSFFVYVGLDNLQLTRRKVWATIRGGTAAFCRPPRSARLLAGVISGRIAILHTILWVVVGLVTQKAPLINFKIRP